MRTQYSFEELWQTPELFVTCSPGLEQTLQEELTELNIPSKISSSGVNVPASWKNIFTVNYESRIAQRVLVPIKRFQCKDAKQLYESVKYYTWTNIIKDNDTIAIDAHTFHHPEIRNSLYASQVVKDGICDCVREKKHPRPNVDLENPTVRLNLFLHMDKALLSFDSSKESLHRRGYRLPHHKAPLMETWAAGLLRMCKYAGQSILDPFCGSGTILIEAAMIATNTPAGYFRKDWGFFKIPGFDLSMWNAYKENRDQKIVKTESSFTGYDIDAETVAACKDQLKSMSYDFIDIKMGDAADISFNQHTWILTNPPLGIRLENQAIAQVFDKMAQKLKLCTGTLQTLSVSEDLPLWLKMRPRKSRKLTINGLDCQLYTFKLYGSDNHSKVST